MHPPKKLHDPSEITDERHSDGKKYPDPAKILAFITDFRFQIISIAIYIALEILVVVSNGAKGSPLMYIAFYANYLTFFYLNCLIVLPAALRTVKSIYIPILWIFCSLILQLFVVLTLDAFFVPAQKSFYGNIDHHYLINYSWRVFQYFTLSVIVWGAITMMRLLLKQKILENNYLYSRVSPHLLFSCLNLIHSGIQKIDVKGAEMIIKLSRFARATMLELASDGKIFLKDEIEMIRNLIEINRLRISEESYVEIETGPEIEEQTYRVPPQLLVSLIDNVFKYGVLDDPNYPAVISIYVKDGNLFFQISNTKLYGPSIFESHKIGIASTRKRLRETYEKRYKLEIEESEKDFKLNLTIAL